MTGPRVMDAIREATKDLWSADSPEIAAAIREDLIAVLCRLPRELTVGEMLTELEES